MVFGDKFVEAKNTIFQSPQVASMNDPTILIHTRSVWSAAMYIESCVQTTQINQPATLSTSHNVTSDISMFLVFFSLHLPLESPLLHAVH